MRPGEDVAETAVHRQAEAGHQVRAASGVRQGRAGRIRLSQHEARGRRRQVQGHRLQGDGHARADADDYVYAIRRLATPRIKSPSFSTMSDYIVGLKEYGEQIVADRQGAAQGPGADRSRPAVPRFPAVPVRGRRGARHAHAAHPREGQVSAVQVLAGDDVPRAHSVGGREVLRAARDGGEEPHAQLLAGRHRPVHADRVHREPAARDRAQSELPRRAVSVRRRARRQGEGLSRRLRQDDSVRRQGGLRPREGRRAAAGEVPPGLLRFAGHRAARLRHGDDRVDERRQEEGQGVPGKGHQAAHDDRSEQLVHRLQLARPGRRQGRHAGAGGAQSQAAAGAVDRHRLGRAHRDLRARAGRRRAGSAAAVALRLSRGRTVGVQSGRLHARSRRQARAPLASTRRRSCSPRRAIPTGATRRPASRWCSTSTTSPRRRPASRRCSTGTRSSSRRSACSSRSARPTTTASRTR